MTKIFIAEDVPSLNKGEGALLFGILESLKVFDDPKFYVVSTLPDIDTQHYSEDSEVVDAEGIVPVHMATSSGGTLGKLFSYIKFITSITLFTLLAKFFHDKAFKLFKSRFWRTYYDADIVIAGHDSSWTPLYHFMILLSSRILKKTSAVYGGTILPVRLHVTGLRRFITVSMTKAALKLADVVTLREALSKQMLEDCGYDTSKAEVLPDLAVLMKPNAKEKGQAILEAASVPMDRPLAGVAFSYKILIHSFGSELNKERRVERACAELAKVIEHIVAQGYRVIFIPHAIGPTPNIDDRIIAKQVLSNIKDTQYIHNLTSDNDARNIKALCGLLDFSLTTRLHFAVDSLTMRTPALLMTYAGDIRCHGILDTILGEHKRIYPIEALDKDLIIQSLEIFLQGKDKIVKSLEQRIPELQKLGLKHGELMLEAYRRKHQAASKKTDS